MNAAALLSAREDAPAEAVRHYRRALALRTWPDATAARAEYNLALALRSLGGRPNVDAAIAALRRAHKLSPGFAPAAEELDELRQEASGAAAPEAPEPPEPPEDSADADDADRPGEARGAARVSEREEQSCRARPHASGCAPSGALSSASALHEAAHALRAAAQRALEDPQWPAAARRLPSSAAAAEASDEALLLAGLVADVSTLLQRLLEADAAAALR